MADPTRGRKKCWSYIAGQRGCNWVRAFERSPGGALYLEWFAAENEPDVDVSVAARTPRRRRMKLSDEDQTRARAVAKAEELAESFTEMEEAATAPVTLERLIDHYTEEVTPTKAKSTQDHDRHAAKVWRTYFNSRPDPSRHTTRHPSTLDRIDWDGFKEARRAGRIARTRPVRDRQVAQDLKYLLAVLNWGSGATPVGASKPYLPEGNPWRPEVRRSQRWEMPYEKNPRRPSMTPEIRAALVKHSPSWQFELALILQRDTRRRNKSIRQLDWSDVDQQAWTIRWRGEFDKAGRESVTPLLSDAAKEALRRAPSRGIAGPVFPSKSDPSQPTSWRTFQTWMQRAKKGAIEAQPESEQAVWKERLYRVGYHAEKRAGVRDVRFRALPPKVQEQIAGTNYETLRKVYDEVTVEDVREAWEAVPRAPTGTH